MLCWTITFAASRSEVPAFTTTGGLLITLPAVLLSEFSVISLLDSNIPPDGAAIHIGVVSPVTPSVNILSREVGVTFREKCMRVA
jgi:hypothetical protein